MAYNPAFDTYTPEAPRTSPAPGGGPPMVIGGGAWVGMPGTDTTPKSTSNPFSTNFTGTQPGTGAGTGYNAVQINKGKPVTGAANPWETMTDITQPTADSKQQISDLQGQLKSLQDGSNYPAMQNSYGLGAAPTSGPQPGSASNPSYASKPITSSATDSSSRGFNPWSLQGEATARNSW